MRFPTLRYPRLCRLLTYIVVLGAFLLPIVLAVALPFVPGFLKVAVLLFCSGALLVYLFREFATLMMMDMALAFLSCYRTARTQYKLPNHYDISRIEGRISRYGTKCTPTAILPQPSDLRYRFRSPWTVYSRGIERIVVTYRTDLLDADTYRAILSSAKTNSRALIGRKKAHFLNQQQKKAALHRVTVIVIHANQVDPRLVGGLYALVCKQSGDDFEDSILPCIVDLSRGSCTFNSLRVPYVGFGYAAKNRGIRLIRQLILGGKFPLADNHNFIPDKDSILLDQSLWEFWKTLRAESGAAANAVKKRLKGMADREITLEDDILFVKWGEQGIMLSAEQDLGSRTITLEEFDSWTYPKVRPIAQKTIRSIKQEITDRYREAGWSVVYGNAGGK